ncbi:MAG: hypothetical protein GXP16_03565 [Gammaproteobacteria bacterium]|nr:hypothetical protein [Gammaproteobacteria bacterium]
MNTKLLSLSLFICYLFLTPTGHAASKLELDTKAKAVLQKLYSEQSAARQLGAKAAGILVFPRVIKAGMGIGGEIGEGVLLKGNTISQYYRVTALSIGFQLGGQAKSEVIMFMTQESLRQFVQGDGWEAGVDGSIAVIEFGVGREIDTNSIRNEIIAFIFDNKGLMYNLSLEGSKFWKINKS